MEFDQGTPVIVFAPSFYREKRIGVVLGLCRDHDGGILVQVMDPNAPIKKVCVDTNIGDTIATLPQVSET